MAKKKRQDNDTFNDDQLDLDSALVEDAVDEDEEAEENEHEDVFAEDESDIAMIRNIENEDNRMALSALVFEEEVGFNPMFDWSTISEAERTRFTTLMSLDKEGVENYSWKKLNVMQKWMVARACQNHGLHEMFREISTGLIKMRKPAPELCIEDIYLELVWDYIETKEYDQASALLDKFEQNFPEDLTAALRVRALMAIDMGDIDKGKNYIDELIHLPFNRNIKGFEDDSSAQMSDVNDGVIQYEIGYALLNMKHLDLALHYFDRARNLANMNDNYELTMAIDNARALALKQLNADE